MQPFMNLNSCREKKGQKTKVKTQTFVFLSFSLFSSLGTTRP